MEKVISEYKKPIKCWLNDIEESASAYKDIDVVIANEKDLVETIVELHPLAVIKG